MHIIVESVTIHILVLVVIMVLNRLNHLARYPLDFCYVGRSPMTC